MKTWLYLLALLFAVNITIPDAAAQTPWHLQPMDSWLPGECYRSPNATSYRDDGDYPIVADDAPLEDRARAAGYRVSVQDIDSYGRIKPEHREHWTRTLAAAEDAQKSRAKGEAPKIAEYRPVAVDDGVEFGDIARWKAAYEREQAREAKKQAKRQAKKNANKSASVESDSPFQEVGLFSRARRSRFAAPTARAAPQYRVECNGNTCRRVKL